MKPANGTYRLTPAERHHLRPYDVVVSPTGCAYVDWGAECPWVDVPIGQFRRVTESGWQFGWTCGENGTYSHWAIDPAPMPGTSPITIIDSGTCEAV